jgi:signal peptidase I
VKRAKLAELLRKDYVQTVLMLVIVVVSVFTFWYGLKFALKTEQPLCYVDGISMHPTLENGDLVLVQGVQNACKIHAAPKDADPPGDILIFYNLWGNRIVHRAIDKKNEGDIWYFETRGDNNVASDGWFPFESNGKNNVVGKVVGRVPLLGYIFMFFEPLQVKLALILLWVILLIIVELVPLLRKKVEESKAETKPL